MEISEREYKELVLAKETYPKEKWCWVKFLKGFFTKWGVKLMVWGASSALVFLFVITFHSIVPEVIKLIFAIGWIVLSVFYFVGTAMDKALADMVGNTKITAEFKAGAQANVNTDIKKTAGGAKGGKC